ncbi:DUF6056 family protein [Streptomyces sp. NPDC014894]|uniref:DUF6056 family protein n=1 Tax=Streptomyces sp. NPDC014894 TaxID=3364931 RepID=UPI00370200C9
MAVDTPGAARPQPPDEAARTGRADGGGEESGGPGARPALWAAALALLPLGLLLAGAWLGQHVRPGADDWCFLPAARDGGIGGMVEKFYFWDNGRIGNALLVGLYARPGVPGHQWFAPVGAVFMGSVLWAVTALGLRRAALSVPRGVPLLVASMVTAVFLFASPNTYKTFFWPASAVSHTVAPVLACTAAIPLLLARTARGRRAALAAAFLVGAFLATLSEAASVVGLVVLSCVLLLSRRIFAERARGLARRWCLAGMAGIGAGALVLLTSPGSQSRRERYGANASMFAPESLTGALEAFWRILGTLTTTWEYLGAVAAGVLLGLVCRSEPGRRAPVVLTHRPLLAAVGTGAFLVSGYLCTLVAYPVFGAGTATVSRAWNDYLLLYAVLLAGLGALLGRALRTRSRGARAVGGYRAAAAAVCAVCCLALAVPLARLGEDMEARARSWDRQDRWLRAQAADGARVLPYKPLSVSAMGEPFGKHGSWPAGCVADYYHVDKMTHSTRLP